MPERRSRDEELRREVPDLVGPADTHAIDFKAFPPT